ncbi:MAG TPA: hypothetical protein VMT38_09455 [Terracidiphilus sp.]|nr:hypothetical protein [Terracidiphilus sp.]
MFLAAACIAVAQSPADPAPAPGSTMSVPTGFSVHESVDLGGRVAGISGSGAMYDTMVNLQSGPRVLGETFTLRALPGTKNAPLDELQVFASGFGGEPNSFAKLDFSKGKYYEFSGLFRRDRQYFDYDLLGNPGIPTGYSIPIGPSTAPTGAYAWPQITQSPFLYNTVRRMSDVGLTLLPLSKVTFRIAYSQNTFQGPSFTPSGNAIAGQELLLQEMQRNSTDDFTGTFDWKPVQGTKLTYEQQIDHYKGDSWFTVAPNYLNVQEPDGTKVSLLDSYQQFVPYGYSTSTGAFSAASNCNATSMISSSTILYSNPNGGLPIVDPACNVISSYIRREPTREIFPTEAFRLQSSSIKNITMNGNIRYTKANMNLPNYYEMFQGLQGANRSISYAGSATAVREVVAVDYGIVWQLSGKISIEDQFNYSNAHQPGTAAANTGTTVTVPTTAGQETINNTTLTSCTTINSTTNSPAGCKPNTSVPSGSPAIGTTQAGYFGQRFTTNDATLTWDATPHSTYSLTWRYQEHLISEGQGTAAHNIPIPANNTTSGEVTIHENGAILTAALHPASSLVLNGSVEAMFNDNVFTPMGFRQLWHVRVHAIYRPNSWATISGAFNDLERHNNTNNNQSFPGNTTPYFGPLNHVDHSRIVSFGTELFPNDRYGLDLNYSYSDVYLSSNSCFQGAANVMPGGTVEPAAANATGTLCGAVTAGHGANNVLFLGKDFMDAPTEYISAAFMYSPVKKFRSNVGYRVNSVSGSRSFTDAGDVNGALVSNYQTPFVSAEWTMHRGLIWKGEYDYFDYGEGSSKSGAQYCNANPALAVGSTSAPVVLCSSVPNTAMSASTPLYGFTSPRNFHANNVVLGLHYDF